MQWRIGAGGNRHVASPDLASSPNACYTTFLSESSVRPACNDLTLYLYTHSLLEKPLETWYWVLVVHLDPPW